MRRRLIHHLKSWLLAFRLKTLTAAIVPIVVAHSLAVALGEMHSWWVSLCALGGALSIQIATNLLNDAIDFKKGADTKERQGPRRVTQSGLFSGRQVMLLGFFFLFIACIFGLPLVLRGGVSIVLLGLVSLFLAYGYTGGPLPLAYLGLGDLFVVLFFGLFAVGGTFYIHSLSFNMGVLVLGLQVGFLSTILIAINNLRDSDTDKKVDKKTLAVRFGDSFVKTEIFVLVGLIYLLNIYYLYTYNNTSVFLTFMTLPLAVYLLKCIVSYRQKSELNKALGLAAALQVSFGFLLAVGLVLQ